MRSDKRLLVALALGLCAVAGRSEAKDMFYFMGYEMVQVIDGDTDTVVADIPMKGWTREAALSSDKKFLYVATNRHWIHKVDLGSNKVVSTTDLNQDGWERFMYGFCTAPGDKTAFAALMSRKTENGHAVIGKPIFAEIDLDSGKILRSVDVPWGVGALVPVKGGKQVYAVGKDLYKIDASGTDLKITETVSMFEKKMNILPLWNYVWEQGNVGLANYYTPELMGLLHIDGNTGAIQEIPLKGDPVFAYSVIYSPDKKTVYGVMDDLNVIDPVKKKYTAAIQIQQGTTYGVNVSSDGKKVYAAGGGNSTLVYDAKTLKQIKEIQMATDGMDIRRVTF